MRLSHYVTLSSHPGSHPTIILACLEPRIAGEILACPMSRLSRVICVDDRLAVVHEAMRVNVGLVVLPIFDRNGVPTSPLVARLHEMAIPVAVCLPPQASSLGVADAIQSGAQILSLAKAQEIESRLRAILRHAGMSAEELLALEHILNALPHMELRRLLSECTTRAHERLSVSRLAAGLGISTRTLCRRTHKTGSPSPADIIAWGRVLRAALLRWAGTEAPSSVARASGFSSVYALRQALSARLRICDDIADLTPLRVSQALTRSLRVGASPASQRSAGRRHPRRP
jgi:AraC-like DNA-binding protein